MTFSIVIPTYNGADFVEQALLSALSQTRAADEIIISDDNSTDKTLTICQKYADKIKIYTNPKGPSGFVNGWNNAISKATGNFISILHQDDIIKPDFLNEIEKALELYPEVKHLFVPCNYIDKKGKSLQEPDYCTGEIKKYSGREYVRVYQTVGHPHIHRCPGVVTHRDIFKTCTYRPEAGHIADDDFFYRVGQYTDIVGILKPLASYRLHQKSETGHLSNNALIQRLATDYIYQLNEFSNNTVFDNFALEYFKKNAIHFSFNEFFMGLKYKDSLLRIKGEKDLSIIEKDFNLTLPLKMRLFVETEKIIGNDIMSQICKHLKF